MNPSYIEYIENICFEKMKCKLALTQYRRNANKEGKK